ncbi:MAG: type II secretion system protein [Phycisphaeraceae bacterium]|nr:MAG: type II secretion system protein [Phycisphaeraceae bacterium]
MIRRGVTFLEVVLAVALLAMLFTTIVSAYGAIRSMGVREQERLSATEVAHRIIMIYAHEGPDKVPGENEFVEYGPDLYRFRLSEESLIEEPGGREGLSIRRAVPFSGLSANRRIEARLVQITVEVFPEQTGRIPSTAEPLASVSRIFNPLDTSTQTDDVLLQHILRQLGEDFQMPVPPQP